MGWLIGIGAVLLGILAYAGWEAWAQRGRPDMSHLHDPEPPPRPAPEDLRRVRKWRR